MASETCNCEMAEMLDLPQNLISHHLLQLHRSGNVMFALPAVEVSTKVRWGGGLRLGEVVATFGLLRVVFGGVRSGRAATVPFGVGAYIGGAY